MPKIYWDVDQQSAAWFKMHSLIPTASRFSDILTPARMEMSASRKKYACQIVAARMMNWQSTSLSKIEHIEDGRAKEPLAIASLELIRDVETKKVGFITSPDGRVGASPDRVVAKGDVIEITVEAKCPTPPVQMEYLLAEKLAAMEPKSKDTEVYRCQRQGQIYVAECDEAIFYSFHERMPACYVRTFRDEPFIKKLQAALGQFNEELDQLTEIARGLGVYQMFPEILPPAEAEHAQNLGDARLMSEAELDGLINTEHMKWGG